MLSNSCLSLTAVLITLLVNVVYSQDCASEYNTYAGDFEVGTTNRWLYENVAPGAECVTASRIQTEDEKCNEYVAGIPDAEWVRYDGRIYDAPGDEVLNIANYQQYLSDDIFPLDACINACRVRTQCRSISWNYDYDKCKIYYDYGYDKTIPVNGVRSYLEKPACPAEGPPKSGSNSRYRLAMKLFASRKYDLAMEKAAEALAADKLWKMNYWFYSITTLVAGDFSTESINQAKATMDMLNVGEFPAIEEQENKTIIVLLDALQTSDVPLTLASGSKRLYEDSTRTDYLAAIIAAITYAKIDRMDEFESLLTEVIQADSSNIAALYLYLDQKVLIDELFNDVTTAYSEKLLIADPNNPYALSLAVYTYYYMNMPNGVLAVKDRTLNSLPAAVANGLISDAEELMILEMVYSYSHFSNLYVNNLNGAQIVETMVENEANNQVYSPDTQAIFKALLYRQRSNRYFQFAFTETPESLKRLPTLSVDDITQIAAQESFFSIGRLSEYMNRQYVVTQQIRNGTYTSYLPMVEKWEQLRDVSPSFDAKYAPVVNYNILLLSAEYALMQGNMRDEVLGSSGYLDQAYLLDNVDSRYAVMGIQEMVGYAAMKLSMGNPAPLGQIDSPANKIPNNIEAVIEDIKNTWPWNTPSKLNIIALLQLAIGDREGSEETLDEATNRVHSASIPWLNKAKETVNAYDQQVSIMELEPIPNYIPATLTFDSGDQTAFDGLDKDWTWTPDVTALEPCTAYRYKDGDVESSVWPEKPEISVMSTMSVGYPSTNAYSCKLRCLFEEKFWCKAFTFGFNRCLLHDQSYDEVAEENRLGVEDETYYDIPECPQQDTNAYSQLLLGGKAMSNNLVMLAMDKFDSAIDLDPLMNLPKTLKALLIFKQSCRDSEEEAKELLEEVEDMRKTSYETSLYNAVYNTVDGQVLDAISDYEDISEDQLVSSLNTSLQRAQPSDNPEIAAQYIYKISKDVLASTQDIDKLQEVSPKSVIPRLFDAFAHYLKGNWRRVIESTNLITSDVANGDYIGSDADSDEQLFVMQLKHFALVQMGKYTEANNMYMTYKGNEKLGAYTYAIQQYTTMIDVVNMQAADIPDVIDNGGDCSDMAAIVAKVMVNSWLYVDPDVDGSRKESEKNRLTEYLNDVDFPMLDAFKGTWNDVSGVFYSLGGSAAITIAEKIKDAGEQSLSHLAPNIVKYLGVQLIHPDELFAWATLSSSNSLETYTFSSVEQSLNKVSADLPGRTVTKWLKYKLYSQWRSYDDSHRDESIEAAKDLLSQWSDGDQGILYGEVYRYWRSNMTITATTQEVKTTTESSKFPDWAVKVIVSFTAVTSVAIVIGCAVWLMIAWRRRKGKELPSQIAISLPNQEADGSRHYEDIVYKSEDYIIPVTTGQNADISYISPAAPRNDHQYAAIDDPAVTVSNVDGDAEVGDGSTNHDDADITYEPFSM